MGPPKDKNKDKSKHNAAKKAAEKEKEIVAEFKETDEETSDDEDSVEDIVLETQPPPAQATAKNDSSNLSTDNGTRSFSLRQPRQLFTTWQPGPWVMQRGGHGGQFPHQAQAEHQQANRLGNNVAPNVAPGTATAHAAAAMVSKGAPATASSASKKKKKMPPKKGKKTVAKKKPKAKGGSFNKAELDNLLDVIEKILPIGKVDWEKVESMHSENVPEERERSLTKIRNQHNTPCAKKPPAGDPDCPPHVRRAKRLSYKIRDRAGCEAIQTGTAPPNFQDTGGTGADVARGTSNGTDRTFFRLQRNMQRQVLLASHPKRLPVTRRTSCKPLLPPRQHKMTVRRLENVASDLTRNNGCSWRFTE